MKKGLITQKQLAFYKLYQSYREDPERYMPGWECIGEVFIQHSGKWMLMSYKCPTRLSDLFSENPTLMERKLIKGKSGSTYFGYRFRKGVLPADIADPTIREFYQKVKFYEKPTVPLA